MNLFQIDHKKLVVLLLPTIMRKPLVILLLQCATVSVRAKHNEMLRIRDDNLYQVHHTGQVCHLRKVLNEAFPSRSTDFIIDDSNVTSEWIYALSEQDFPYDQLKVEDENSSTQVEVWSEDYILVETTPFMVSCPPEIYSDGDSMNVVRHLVNTYKLVSKRAIYLSI